MKSNLVLIGFMGCGKSTIAKLLAKLLEMKLIDVDYEIEKQEGISIREIFDRGGEKHFREIEKQVTKKLSLEDNAIISTGGGIILNKENIENLKRDSLIIYLNVDRKVLYKRLKNSKNRPLLDGDKLWDRINTTLDYRQELYIDSSDYDLKITNESPYEVADKIKKLYIEKG